MLVTSSSNESRWLMYAFLKAHGVELCRSEDFQAMGNLRTSDKQLVGVVGFNGFTGNTCAMHVAGIGNWVTRDLLWAAFDYPFTQCKIRHIITTVAADNVRALKFDKHLGFEVLHRLRDGWADGIDLIILHMEREQCRWLSRKELKRELQAA